MKNTDANAPIKGKKMSFIYRPILTSCAVSRARIKARPILRLWRIAASSAAATCDQSRSGNPSPDSGNGESQNSGCQCSVSDRDSWDWVKVSNKSVKSDCDNGSTDEEEAADEDGDGGAGEDSSSPLSSGAVVDPGISHCESSSSTSEADAICAPTKTRQPARAKPKHQRRTRLLTRSRKAHHLTRNPGKQHKTRQTGHQSAHIAGYVSSCYNEQILLECSHWVAFSFDSR